MHSYFAPEHIFYPGKMGRHFEMLPFYRLFVQPVMQITWHVFCISLSALGAIFVPISSFNQPGESSLSGEPAHKKKPDFFIVGAPKSGTTAMDHYLAAHPDIFMAKKEIHFFGSDLS